MLLDILKKNPHSESGIIDDVDKDKVAIAWKTGTSYGFRDAWTVGLVSDHVFHIQKKLGLIPAFRRLKNAKFTAKF